MSSHSFATRMPCVSIITPSYNQAAFIEETIISVLNQDYPNIEYIIIDGGSTDGSVEIIDKYADRLAYWTSEPDRGQSHAINKGLRRATGEIVAWLNSDDVYCPGAVSYVVGYFARHPEISVLYGNSEYIDGEGRHLGYFPARPFSRDALFGQSAGAVSDFIPQPSVFIRAQAMQRTTFLDENLQCALDYDLWGQLVQAGEFACVSRTLSQYRITPVAKTSALRLRSAAEMVVVSYRYSANSVRLRSLAYYFSVAAQQRTPPRKAVADLLALLSQCGHPMGRGKTQKRTLWALAYGGYLIASLFPVWRRYVTLTHGIRSRSRQKSGDRLFYHGPIPMQAAPPDLD